MEFASLDLNKVYSYADYLKWQFTDRVELILGKIIKMSPAPSTNHQIISNYINYKLFDFLEKKGCLVFSAPFDVRLPDKKIADNDIFTVVQPDICVVCDMSKIDQKGCIGAPDIVVEILSPSSNKTELKSKYELYEKAGVREYWIASPQDRTFLIYTLINGKYSPSRLMTEGDTISSVALPGFSLDLSKLFERLL